MLNSEGGLSMFTVGKKLLGVLACVLILASGAKAAEKTRVDIISTPFGTASYVIGSAFETIVNKNDYSFTINHTETPGQAFNITKLNKDKNARKNTICVAGGAINWLAKRGETPFKQKMESMRPIATYNIGAIWLVTQKKELGNIEALRGKGIALGRLPQVLWGYEPKALLEHGYPEDFAKSLKLQLVGTKDAATAFLNNQVDVCAIGGYLSPDNALFEPSPQTVEILASGRTLYHIDWGKEPIEKTAKVDVPMIPFQLAAGTVAGMDKPIWVFTDVQTFCVHSEFPEELAYQVTKAFIDHVSDFAQYHALGKLMTRKGLVFGIDPKEMHPGALRAYKEAGLL